MPDQEQLRAAMEPFCSDFGRWPTVIIHSDDVPIESQSGSLMSYDWLLLTFVKN
jgi:hypothetical protein